MAMKVALGSLALLLVLETVACSAGSTSSSGTAGSPPGPAGGSGSVAGDKPFAVRSATSEIGKDGVELSVYLYDYDACATKDAGQPASFTQLGVHLYGQGTSPSPGTYALSPAPDRNTASGGACLRLVSAASGGVSAVAGGCHAALSGTVTVTSVSSDGTASGTFDIVFSTTVESAPSASSGSYHETGSFQSAAPCR